jgi:hypothetical protein
LLRKIQLILKYDLILKIKYQNEVKISNKIIKGEKINVDFYKERFLSFLIYNLLLLNKNICYNVETLTSNIHIPYICIALSDFDFKF